MMNLAEMLSYADIGQLNRIAATYRCECNGNSKNDLIQSILAAINRRDVFEAQIASMEMEDLRFMNYLLFDPRDAFSLEDLLARAQQSKFDQDNRPARQEETPAQYPPDAAVKKGAKRSKKGKTEPAADSGPRGTISRFKQYGWLFNGYSGANRYLFHVPADVKERFKEALERKFASLAGKVQGEPQAYRDEQRLLGDDIQQFLTFVHHNEIPLAADGAMYKRSIMMVLDLLGVREELPGKGEWRFGYGRRMKDYPNRLSFIYDYCYYNHWIEESGAALTLTVSGQERQALGQPEQPDKLYRFWLRLYKGAVPNIRACVYWMDKLAKNWVSVQSLWDTLIPYIKPYYYDQPDTILRVRICGMMMHLGMLRIGEHEENGQVCRMTPLGRSVAAGLSIEEDAIVLD